MYFSLSGCFEVCASACTVLCGLSGSWKPVSILRITVPVCLVCKSLSPSSDKDKQLHLPRDQFCNKGPLCFDNRPSLSLWSTIVSLSDFSSPGGGGERRHGEGEAGQQEDPVQPAAGSCGSTFPHVKSQEYGEHPQTCSSLSNKRHQPEDVKHLWH